MLGKGGFLGGSAVKNLPATQEPQETQALSPSWEDTLDEVLAATLAFLPVRRVKESDTTEATQHAHTLGDEGRELGLEKAARLQILAGELVIHPSCLLSSAL